MTPKSKKQKAYFLQNLVAKKILKTFPHLKKRDVKTALNGQSGPDILLSKTAKKLVGVNFECKNQGKMRTLSEWLKQSERHAKGKLTPVVVHKGTRSRPVVICYMEDFFKFIKEE